MIVSREKWRVMDRKFGPAVPFGVDGILCMLPPYSKAADFGQSRSEERWEVGGCAVNQREACLNSVWMLSFGQLL